MDEMQTADEAGTTSERLGDAVWGRHYTMLQEGLFYTGDSPSVALSSPFNVVAEAACAEGGQQALLLNWTDRSGQLHEWLLSREDLFRDPRAALAPLVGKGLRIYDTGPKLRTALMGVRPREHVRLVSQTGWHGAAFVLGNGKVVGSPVERLFLPERAASSIAAVACAGTLDGWRSEVAGLVQGNPLPAFALLTAFAGPLLQIAGEDGGGIHLHGPSKSGKTAAAKATVSVWGLPTKQGGLRDWRATTNGLEAACQAATDMLLVLDEIHQADPRQVTDAIYMLLNQSGKLRMKKDLSLRPTMTWRLFVLSTGEAALDVVVESTGKRMPEGAAMRMPSVAVEGDAWPVLHGEVDRAHFMTRLHKGMAAHHGHAGRLFLQRLTSQRAQDEGEIVKEIEAARLAMAAALPDDASPQVRHVARVFALVAAAGELATRWEVLPWAPGEANAAALTVLQRWLARRDGTGSGEDAGALQRLQDFLAMHGGSRFEDLNPPVSSSEGKRPVVYDRAGWRTAVNGNWRYMITPAAWRTEVFTGADAIAAAKALADAGVLMRGDGKNIPRKVLVPGEGYMRLYVVKEGVLGATRASSP